MIISSYLFIINNYFKPASHYLLGIVRILQTNRTGAHLHIKMALDADPQFPGARDAMRALRCHMRV